MFNANSISHLKANYSVANRQLHTVWSTVWLALAVS